MTTAVFCHDGPDAFRLRQDHFKAHSRHIVGQAGDLRLAAPLALSDGAAAVGDHEIAASLLVFASPEPAGPRAAVLADPYMQAGAWSGADIYSAGAPFGTWSPDPVAQRAAFSALAPEMEPRPANGRPYVVLCEDVSSAGASDALRLEHGRYIARLFDRMLLGIALQHVEPLGEPPPRRWGALYVFEAGSLEEAARLADEDPFARTKAWRPEAFAAPAAFGTWIPRP